MDGHLQYRCRPTFGFHSISQVPLKNPLYYCWTKKKERTSMFLNFKRIYYLRRSVFWKRIGYCKRHGLNQNGQREIGVET